AHALIREVLYGQLVARRRKQLHQQVGAALEAQSDAEGDASMHAEVAHQFFAAEDWPKAVQYAISAGDWSRAHYATHTALRLNELALDAPRHLWPNGKGADAPEVTLRLHERIAKLHMVLNQQFLAEEAFTRMLELARAQGNRLAEGEALVWKSAI